MRNLALLLSVACFAPAYSAIEGSLDPECVVEKWGEVTAYPEIIDINFSDTTWPNSWTGETGRDCPDYSQGGYVNAVINVPANADGAVRYPVLFHNCTFATKASYNGYAGATAAFCRQYYIGENAAGNGTWGYNNWTAKGHTLYLEDNITTEKKGSKEVPTYGDGMPDKWEMAYGLNPAHADNNVLNADGYTALEVYLSSLMDEKMDTDFGSGIQTVYSDSALRFDASTRTL